MVIRHVLRKIAGGRPLLLWLDDLQHAGPGTFELLTSLHRDEPDLPLFILGTAREDLGRPSNVAATRLRELRGRMSSMVLDVFPLSPAATRNLVRSSLSLDEAAADEAARRSRGNPLFALQQVHAWALSGRLELVGNVYRVPREVLSLRPATTAGLWQRRLASLPRVYRASAYAAATLGFSMSRASLFAACAALRVPADAPERLVEAQVLVSNGFERYRFAHELLMDHLLREAAAAAVQASARASASRA
jgi:predicted ATPase